MSKATQGFLILVAILVMIGCVTGQIGKWVVDSFFHNRVTYGQEVGMLQPSGWNLNRDQQASEINVNNSQANANNGQWNLANAQATAIVNTSQETLKTQYVGGLSLGICAGIPLTIMGILFLLMLLVKRPI